MIANFVSSMTYECEAMATHPRSIAEENPFLTGTSIAPATMLSEESDLGPGVRNGIMDEQEGAEVSEQSQCFEGSSDEDDLEVDELVQEEMTRLEETFQENGLKFRMIDRIGEGDSNYLENNRMVD